MNNLREQVIKEYCSKYYQNADIKSYLKGENDLIYYSLEELKNVTNNWFPLCCYKEEKTGKLIYGGSTDVVHTYTQGETGSGKTTRLIMQKLKALSMTANKPSFIIGDYHGEIYENISTQLKDEGYIVKILNCDDPEYSDTYNPLKLIAEETLKNKTVTDSVARHIKQISDLIVPVLSKDEPFWELGSCDYFLGLIYDCLESLLEGEMELENINLYNVVERHYWVRQKLAELYTRNIREIPHYKNKKPGTISTQKMMAITNNSETTRDCYYGILENNLGKIFNTTAFKLSSSNTIDIEEALEKPTAIFIQSGTSSMGTQLISLMIQDLYEVMIKKRRYNCNKNLHHNVHCFIDEFANCNFGTGEDFIKMLTTSRKFGLFWHMYLQCDAQLDKKYNDPNIGDIIRANTTEIFLGSQDYKTISRFASSCGKQTIESLNSKIQQSDVRFETIDIITPSKLSLLPKGYMYIRVNRSPLLYSYFEAYYNCEEFFKFKSKLTYPTNDFNYKETLIIPEGEKKENKRHRNFFENTEYKDLKSSLRWIKKEDGKYLLAVDVPDSEFISQHVYSFAICDEKDLYISEETIGEENLKLLEIINKEDDEEDELEAIKAFLESLESKE